MASSKEYLVFILEQLRGLDGVTYRPMMGEYLLYYQGILFGGIYDDRLLFKKGLKNQKHGMSEEIPYPGAKPMYLVEEVDNCSVLEQIVLDTVEDLKRKWLWMKNQEKE